MVKWMKTEFPNFIWTSDVQSVELHTMAESFIVEPEAVDQDITIIGNNTVSISSSSVWPICTHTFVFVVITHICFRYQGKI